MNGWMDGWMDTGGWMDGYGWMDGWMDTGGKAGRMPGALQILSRAGTLWRKIDKSLLREVVNVNFDWSMRYLRSGSAAYKKYHRMSAT
ncbi:hypothetical protein V9T40_008021 [Parthenolecanium corni]|uniref:Uncharacterized protein n=1 Tax=Parthenolecanium corni TaxID=536013 RepID=A0AAN9Y979_9HEMI